MADNDRDTRPADLVAQPTASSASKAQDAPANGSSAADGAGKNSPAGTGTDTAVADPPPALPADSIGPTRDSPTLTFSRPVSAPVSPAADDWMPSGAGEPPPADSRTGDASAPAKPNSASPASSSESTAEPSGQDPSPTAPSSTAPSSTEPSPKAVSAAAFAWETPEPPPVPQSSPARNFVRPGGNAKTAAATGAAAAASPAKTPADQAAEPARGKPSKRSAKRQARQAHLTVARVEPWSVMKFSFVVSLVAFVILFVAVSVIYGALSALGVFESLQRVVQSVTSSQDSAGVNAAKWFTASKVLGYTGLLGSLNIVLITAMATIGAVVYNLTSRLIGGVEVTLRETE
jgi:Transmembrane domain of unknown function (DUF3566)